MRTDFVNSSPENFFEPLRPLRRFRSRIRHYSSRYAAALAKLPRHRRFLWPLHQYCRRLHILERRKAAPPDTLSLQQCPDDLGGRYIYVRDGDSVWSPGWKPVKAKLDKYECRHGLGYTKITGAKDGIEVELLFFVPPGETLEVWKTTVRNTSSAPKSVSLFSYVEFCLSKR